jgi:hypothetical protein
VATFRHPLRGFTRALRCSAHGRSTGSLPTGSRTHPWLDSVTRFAGSPVLYARGLHGFVSHGFADSPVARSRHPLRGLNCALR